MASGYHAWNFGHLLGEIVRRVTGMSLKQFVAEKIASPLGADFQLGVWEQDLRKVGTSVALPSSKPSADFGSGPFFLMATANTVPPPDMGR